MTTVPTFAASKPLDIRMNANDNVAIVVNDGGLPAGTELPGECVPQTRCRSSRWRPATTWRAAGTT